MRTARDGKPCCILPLADGSTKPSHGRDRALPPTHLTETLYTFGEGSTPHYKLALTGRGKKNWKSADHILTALYRFLAWESPQGNDCFLLENDEGQAGDDLKLLKKVIAVNPMLDREVIVKQKEIERAESRTRWCAWRWTDVAFNGKLYLRRLHLVQTPWFSTSEAWRAAA